MSKEEIEMKIVVTGSRGLWYSAQEFSIEDSVMMMVTTNYILTLDLMASFRNRVVLRYFSAAFKTESLGQNIFNRRLETWSSVGSFLHFVFFGWGVLHLVNEKCKGVGVFAVWMALPTSSKFIKKQSYSKLC